MTGCDCPAAQTDIRRGVPAQTSSLTRVRCGRGPAPKDEHFARWASHRNPNTIVLAFAQVRASADMTLQQPRRLPSPADSCPAYDLRCTARTAWRQPMSFPVRANETMTTSDEEEQVWTASLATSDPSGRQTGRRRRFHACAIQGRWATFHRRHSSACLICPALHTSG